MFIPPRPITIGHLSNFVDVIAMSNLESNEESDRSYDTIGNDTPIQ